MQGDESLLLGLLFDFLTRQALMRDPGLHLYTEAMSVDDDELLAGVMVGIKEHIALDPYASRFALSGPLRPKAVSCC